MTTHQLAHPSVLVVGASRGLGLAIAQEYAARGAEVIATVRGATPPALRELVEAHAGRVSVESVDVADATSVEALAHRLGARRIDLLFVVAGISLAPREQAAADGDTDDFLRTMATNALGVMRAVERLQPLVSATGTVAVLSSGQGSVANNTSGGFEVYRASKAALNQLMRSFAARHEGDRQALLLLAPGWVRTDLGGDGAGLEIGDAVPRSSTRSSRSAGLPACVSSTATGRPWPGEASGPFVPARQLRARRRRREPARALRRRPGRPRSDGCGSRG